MVAVVVRDAVAADVPAITDIANALLATTTIEWTDTPHTIEERATWMSGQAAAGHPVVVADVDGEVAGWAAWGAFRDVRRWPGYRFTVEHTIHVRRDRWGSGVGRALMDELIRRARAAGLHTLVAAIDGENEASIRFHERLGFVEVARMPQVGAKFGRWLDVVMLQYRLDDAPEPPG
jgi:phosphinothricin acetyltransferase